MGKVQKHKGAIGLPGAKLRRPGALAVAEDAVILEGMNTDNLPEYKDKTPLPKQQEALIKTLGIDFSKMGYKPRPAYAPKGPTPYDVIQQLASMGLTQRQVHLCLGWSEKTWTDRKAKDEHIMECYDMGFNRGVGMIANRHFQAAMQGSIPAMQFILRTKGGFQEPKEEKTGPQDLANAIREFLTGINATTGMAPKPEAQEDEGAE